LHPVEAIKLIAAVDTQHRSANDLRQADLRGLRDQSGERNVAWKHSTSKSFFIKRTLSSSVAAASTIEVLECQERTGNLLAAKTKLIGTGRNHSSSGAKHGRQS
jgi:hypothetical protein